MLAHILLTILFAAVGALLAWGGWRQTRPRRFVVGILMLVVAAIGLFGLLSAP